MRQEKVMNKTAKIAISLPEKTLDEVEKERKVSGESRSEFFRRAVESLLKKEQESKEAALYIKGYRAMPETAGEVDAVNRLGESVLAEEPW
jgi:metal-responsive CopG/Arc/MetJ family transcriptional regulator